MENITIRERLKKLRECMALKGIDYYLIPTADFHGSEYVSDYFKVREYFCGFSGSNGTLVVWRDGAGLWTDGRYFIQAQNELEGTGVELFRMMEEGVPTIAQFLKDHMENGSALGFDGRVFSAKEGKKYEKNLGHKDIRFFYGEDLSKEIWLERPDFPCGKIFIIPDSIAGKSVTDKLQLVREKMKGEGVEAFILSKLDDIMWLLNIRGCDVECNPVAMSYAYIDMDKCILFIQKNALTEAEIRQYFGANNIDVRHYDEITDFVKNEASGRVLTDIRYLSYTLYKNLEDNVKVTLVEKKNPTELLKAVKNPVELANMEKIYLKDSIALTKFIYWLKTNIGKIKITEISAADKLEEFRRAIPEFMDLSFPTIAGYKENAAMMHYEATKDKHAVLKPEGMLLVDSGGQYMGGTTDVTRTIVLGEISEEEKRHYTLVLMGMLALSNAHWIHGCSGRNLDILARQYLWNEGLDYKCGTGHGVGYILNVHEGPQSMRWRFKEGLSEAVIEEGMDITNEPGVYIEGSHGIRIENVMVAKNDIKNEYGQFMHFDTLTWVPIDMDAVDVSIMTKESHEQLIKYQNKVYEKLSTYLTDEERKWLEQCCKLI